MNRGVWWAIVHGVAKSRTWLNERARIWHTYDCCKDLTDITSVILKTTWEVDTANISVFWMRNLSPERRNYLSVSWETYLESWSQELWGERRDERSTYGKVPAQCTQDWALIWVSSPQTSAVQRSVSQNKANDVQDGHLISSRDLQFWPY